MRIESEEEEELRKRTEYSNRVDNKVRSERGSFWSSRNEQVDYEEGTK